MSSVMTRHTSRAIESHRQEIEHFLERELGCSHTAQDLFQTVVENLLHRSPAAPIDNIRAYLYRAARNALNNHYRGLAVRARHAVDTPMPELTITPEQILAGEQTLSRLNQAIRELPILTRQILILHRIHGISQRDIAAHFGVHISTVEKRLKQALVYCLDRCER